MQVMPTAFLIDPPRSSPDISATSLTSPLLFRRPPETLQKPPLIPPKVRTGSTGLSTLCLPLDSTTIAPSPKRLNICGFSPLPSIIASPLCTPTSSLSFQTQNEVPSTRDHSAGSSSRVFYPPTPPTWIATPPTPPSKTMRRSNTISARRSTFNVVPPSTSFPASVPMPLLANVYGDRVLKRSTSDPTLSPRLPVFPVFTSFMGEDIAQSPEAISANPFDATFSLNGGVDGPDLLFRVADDAEEPSPEGSWSDHDSIEDVLDAERNKDALRKYHALKELLATELGYLTDLKAMVTVYLRNLPTLAVKPLITGATFSRSSASFASGPWVPSYTQLQAAALSSSYTLTETQNSHVKEVSAKPRFIFSDADIEFLARNGEEILQLHEHFIRELRIILEPLGFTMEPLRDDGEYTHLDNLDAAIRAVSAKFATEASRFNAYQSFCAGHSEALDIIRKAYQQFPLELDSFEQRCATMVSEMKEEGLKPTVSEPRSDSRRGLEPIAAEISNIDERKRAKSSSSLDGAVRTLRRRSSNLIVKEPVAAASELKREKSTPRIAFTDYLIKPIQRVCKYPLLLDQLLPSKAVRVLSQTDTRSDVDVVVESAAQAMRHVAASVDEARRRQDIATQSALISSRIYLSSSSSGSSSPSVQTLSAEFLASLGNCLLAGSLDSMYYRPDRPLNQMSTIKAKYYGAFLYPGGYLILVKVSKGRKYEAKHWFSLADFEIDDEGSLLPCSFKLSYGEQHFELAAASQREKETWLSSIRESLSHSTTWVHEPLASFKFDEKGELLPELEEVQGEPPLTGLATIRSIPELSHTSDAEIPEPFFASLRGNGKSKKKRVGYEIPPHPRPEIPPPPSRRSSAQSVKAIFSPMTSDPETLLIRRSSPTARLQVDQELQDVMSRTISTSRSYASTHELELFQVPKTSKSSFSKPNSGISMPRLSKHESVRVPRRRTTEGLESSINRRAAPLKSSGSRRAKSKKLSITSIDSNYTSASMESADFAHPSSSQSSSRSASLRTTSTGLSSIPLPSLSPNTELSPLKTRSFVRNVKGIFQLRPVSPNAVVENGNVSQPFGISFVSPEQEADSQGMLQRWTRDSFRRRTRSVPDEPDKRSVAFDEHQPYTITTSRTNLPLP
ncbi:hypothetical protein CPB84DRAFT_1840921 [Gymnopilus junonius]|uniref:DH domain-containing protein n=1 Tax=Gymnopilus junonius TaxID=109634 RepID=A0A9P5NZ47_GYMJU|nr:hypothetical protein CPB84DRAFT_1840921 [Gymnopilus junonius]